MCQVTIYMYVRLRWLWHLYPSVGLPAMHVLVVTHLCRCVEIGDIIPLSCTMDDWAPGLVPRPETPVFPSKIRLPSNTNTISIPVLTGLIKVVEGNTITYMPIHLAGRCAVRLLGCLDFNFSTLRGTFVVFQLHEKMSSDFTYRHSTSERLWRRTLCANTWYLSCTVEVNSTDSRAT